MNFSVVWRSEAEQELAEIWLAAANRNAVARAAHAIDLALSSAPGTTGVVIFDTVREYVHPPLGVEFETVEADRRVFVLTCWGTTTGRPGPTGN